MSSLLRRSTGRNRRGGAAPPVLSIASISPNLGDTLGGSTHTASTGGVLGTPTVTVGGTSATDVVRVSATEVTFRAPAKAAGSYDVVITDGAKSATLSSGYEAWSPIVDYAAARMWQADSGVTSATSSVMARSTRITDAAGWSSPGAADGVGVVKFDNKYWRIGGWYTNGWESGTVDTTNEVWSSSDGQTWTLELAHDASPPTSGTGARFRRRHSHGCITHTHNGTEYIYVIGGDHLDGSYFTSGYPRDIWRSSDGTTWERVLADADATFQHTMLHMVWSLGGALYIAGGQTDISDPATCVADVYKSTDGGATWTHVTAAPGWAARGAVIQPPVHDDGKVYIIGGGKYHNTPASRTYYNDVWSYDGTTWTEVLADGHGQWAARHYHCTVSHSGYLVIINGYNTASANISEVITSSDNGANWTSNAFPLWHPTDHAQGAVSDGDNEIILVGGINTAEDVYRIGVFAAEQVSAWADRGSGGKNVAQATGAAQPLVLTAAMNGNDSVVFDGADDYMDIATADIQGSGGRFCFWVGRPLYVETTDDTNFSPAATVIGDNTASTFCGFGFNGDALEYTEGASAWVDIDRGSDVASDRIRCYSVAHISTVADLYFGSTKQGTSGTVAYNASFEGWKSLGVGYNGTDFGKFEAGALGIIDTATAPSATFFTKLAKWAQKWGAV